MENDWTRELDRLKQINKDLLKACEGLIDLIHNEIGYRSDSESEIEKDYANRVWLAQQAIVKAKGI